MDAADPAAGPPFPFLELPDRPFDVLLPRLRFLDERDPTNPLVPRERRKILPGRSRGTFGSEGLPEIRRHRVRRSAGNPSLGHEVSLCQMTVAVERRPSIQKTQVRPCAFCALPNILRPWTPVRHAPWRSSEAPPRRHDVQPVFSPPFTAAFLAMPLGRAEATTSQFNLTTFGASETFTARVAVYDRDRAVGMACRTTWVPRRFHGMTVHRIRVSVQDHCPSSVPGKAGSDTKPYKAKHTTFVMCLAGSACRSGTHQTVCLRAFSGVGFRGSDAGGSQGF